MAGILGEDFMYGEDAKSFENAPKDKKKVDKDKILSTALGALSAAAQGLLGQQSRPPGLPGGVSVGSGTAAQAQGQNAAQPSIDPYILQRILGGR